MHPSLLDHICCPVNLQALELEVFEETEKRFGNETHPDIVSGLLKSSTGFVYPIVNGHPRIQLESFLEYADFIKRHKSDYGKIKADILEKYSFLVDHCVKKNKKTKNSFGMEWSVFDYDSDKTWNWTAEERKKRFLEEMQHDELYFQGKTLIDVGSGNGVLTSALADFGMTTFGLDVTPTGERAHAYNKNPNTHFIQGDLQYPCFKRESLDIVYSSGVIHHTNNTELSFSIISELLKNHGLLYIWLYHPIDDLKHHFLNWLRGFTNKLPMFVQYWFYLIFLVPQALIKARLKGKKRTWREQLINFFDVLGCEFRFEHVPNEVSNWYWKRGYSDFKVTISEYYGFGVVGKKDQ